MLTVEEIPGLVARMWNLHQNELGTFDKIHDYVKGERGKPTLPATADAEVKEIRENCVHNVLDKVVDAFVQNLSVVGYHNGDSSDNIAGWKWWQTNQMDARQSEIHNDAVKYGVGYVTVSRQDGKVVPRPRSPRQMLTIYNDPQIDRWPQVALEVWIDETDAKPRRKGVLLDDTYEWPLDLGEVPSPTRSADEKVDRVMFAMGDKSIGDPVKHGATFNGQPVCPVVRYINRRESEERIRGEVERLIVDQKQINIANFDRMIVAKYGAFPWKVISGWTGTREEVLKMSAASVATFDDDVKAQSFPAASLDPYNGLLDALEQHVASRAQISPTYVNAKYENVGAGTVAATEANQQRKLTQMRESLGESHEQLIGLALEMTAAGTADVDAEVVWRDTEARDFGVIADGIIKIAQALMSGAPIEPLLPLVPGVTQQMVAAMRKAAEKSQQKASVTSLVQAANQAASAAQQDPQVAQLASQTQPGRGPVIPDSALTAPSSAPAMV